MGGLIGFGSTLVTTIWALALGLVLCWMVRQVVKRRPVTIVSYVVFFGFLLPVILQYPFAFSPLNGLTIGPERYANYQSHVDAAFLITSAGMVMFVFGYVIGGSRRSDFAPVNVLSAGIRVWTQSVFIYLSSAGILLLFGLLFGVGLLGAAGARNLAQAAPALRPFYNVVHILLPLVIGLDLLVGVERRRRVVLLLALFNFGLGVLTGARGVAFGGLLLAALTILAHASLLERLNVTRALKLLPLAAAVLLAAVYLADVREGQYNIALTVATLGAKLFYGNNFSDLRDFAWVRSYWSGDHFLGRTQLAGLLAFVPSALSTFREEWNWGVITTSIVGLDSRIHPGLRTGPFGEMYFNFGLAGVVLSGVFYGYVARRIHTTTLAAVNLHTPYEAKLRIFAGFVTLNLVGSFLNTAGFFAFYLIAGLLIGLQVFDQMLRAIRTDRRLLGSGMSDPSHP